MQPIEYKEPGGKNFLYCVRNLMDVVEAEAPDTPAYATVGGGASAALGAEGTVIDTTNRLILPPVNLYKPQYRENGSLADCDILLFSTDKAAVNGLRRALTPDQDILKNGDETMRAHEEAKPGADLKIGVTPLATLQDYEKGLALTRDFVSERVEYPNGTRRFNIYNLSTLLPDEYFEPWQQQLPSGGFMPVMHPVIQVANYGSRTSYGVRDRDVKKIQKMHRSIGAAFGMDLEWTQGNRQVDIRVDKTTMAHPGVEAALEFLTKKNALRYKDTRPVTSRRRAALFALKQALHRPADKYMEKYGQEGLLFDHVLSRFTGEDQTKLTPKS